MSNSTTQLSRSVLSFVLGLAAIFFGVAAAIAITEASAGPIVIGVELLIAALAGALCVVTGRRR